MERFENYGLTKVQFYELFDYSVAKFDVITLESCKHFMTDPEFMRALQYMQNTSAFLFLLLVHVPLSKMSALWSFGTCFIVWFIDNRTKETIYNICAFISRVFFSPTEACKRWRKSQKEVHALDTARGSLSAGIISEKDREVFENCVNWVCLNIFLFISVALNYFYSTLLHDVTVQTTTYAIQLMDAAGFDAHFIRFVHMTLFE